MKKPHAILLLVSLLADLAFSFWQHYHVALDGDLAAIVLPAEWYSKVLENPFGEAAILNGEKYGGTNRFFAHWSMSVYLRNAPLLLQRFVPPIESVYLACALLKTAVQLGILILLAGYVPSKNKSDKLLAAALLAPLFQTFGYNGTMGLIEKSITYTFFYSLPICVLLLYLLPFYRRFYLKMLEKWTFPLHLGVGILSMILPLSGPLVPAVILLVWLLVLIDIFIRHFFEGNKTGWRRKNWLLFYLSLSGLFCLYSLYLGSFNVESQAVSLSLPQRYISLLMGIGSLFTLKIGLPLLTLAVLLNVFFLLKIKQSEEAGSVMNLLKWMAIFSLAYIVLLPLGGYRGYRPNIIRHDTVMPVTICLAGAYAITSCYLLHHFQQKKKQIYGWATVAFAFIFTLADEPRFDHNACEKRALEMISRSTEPVVKLEENCPVLSWETITKPQDSETNAHLLQHWRITDQVRLYHYLPDK